MDTQFSFDDLSMKRRKLWKEGGVFPDWESKDRSLGLGRRFRVIQLQQSKQNDHLSFSEQRAEYLAYSVNHLIVGTRQKNGC